MLFICTECFYKTALEIPFPQISMLLYCPEAKLAILKQVSVFGPLTKIILSPQIQMFELNTYVTLKTSVALFPIPANDNFRLSDSIITP